MSDLIRLFIVATLLAGLFTAPVLTAHAADRPNIVLLESDDHHPDVLGCMGSQVKTPHIDRLAARGALFRNNVCPGTQCAPSRNALLTASYPHNTGVYHNRDGSMAEEVWTFPAALKRAGYATSMVGKHHFKPHGSTRSQDRTPEDSLRDFQSLGFDSVDAMAGKVVAATGKMPPGADPYRDHLREQGLLEKLEADYRENRQGRFSAHASVLPEEHHHDTYIATRAIRFLEEYERDRPFFLWVDFVAPHPPADPPQPYHSMYNPADMRGPIHKPDAVIRGPLRHASIEELKKFRASYYAMVTHLDAQIGRIVEALRATGQLENTLIVLTGDQGSMLGDLGLWGKGQFYRGSLNSPLVIAGPGVKPGTVVDRPVELTDLPPTFLNLAGASPDDLERCYGESLLPLLTGRGEYRRRYAFAELHDEKMVFDGRYKYVQADEPMMLDLKEDPQELSNVIGKHPEVEARLKRTLAEWLEATPPVRPPNPRQRPNRNR